MRLFNFSKPETVYHELVSDIGSGSIAISIVRFETGRLPKIIHTERQSFPHNRVRNAEVLEGNLLKCFKDTLYLVSDYAHKNHIIPRSSSVFYASPWVVSQTKTFRLKQEQKFIFTREIVNKILEKNIDFLSHIDIKSTPFELASLELVERKVTRVLVDNTEAQYPFGKKVNSVAVSVFVSAIVRRIHKEIEKDIKHVFVGSEVQHHSFTLSFFTMVRGIFQYVNDFYLMDIADEVTDLTMVIDSALRDTVSLPMGRRAMIRRVEQVCGFETPLAVSALSMYLHGTIRDKSHKKLGPAVKDLQIDWLTHFNRAVATISKGVGKEDIPKTVFVIADEDILPLFEKALIHNKTQHSGYKVLVMQPEIFEQLVKEPTGEKKDFFITLETAYVNSLKMVE